MQVKIVVLKTETLTRNVDDMQHAERIARNMVRPMTNKHAGVTLLGIEEVKPAVEEFTRAS